MILNDTRPRRLPAGLTVGRWTVHAAGSRLLLDIQVRGMLGVRGRFAALAGHVDVPADPMTSRIRIDVPAASLTTGNSRRDALLSAAGLIDPAAGPVIHYRSHALERATGSGAWRVRGVLGTARGECPLTLELADPVRTAEGFGLRARGRISREAIAHLLARPGAARLLGASADLDLAVELAPPSCPAPS